MNYQERSGFEPYDMSWNDDDSTPRTDLGDLLNPTKEAYEMPESRSPTPIDMPDETGGTEDDHDIPHPAQESDLKKDIHHNFSQVSNLASMLEGVESTTESVSQHKYSRLAQSSYDYFNSKGNADLVNKNLKNPKYSHINDLGGFELDKELSTLDDAVLHNKLTGETVISFRGTTSNIKETKAFLKDWEVNSKIMFNPKSVENTRRMKNAFSNTENVISKYGKENVKVAGHSQGGYVSSSVAQKLDLEGHHYNPAISVRQINQNKKGMFFKNTAEQNIYKTHTDFASPLAYDRHIQKNFNVKTVNYNPEITERSPFVSTHSLEQFTPTVEEELGRGMVRCERSTLVSSFKNSLGPAVNVGAQAYSAGKDFQQDIKEGGGVAVETAKIGLDAAKNAEEYVVDNMIMDADHSHHDDLRVDDELVVQKLKLPANATVEGLTVSHISGLSDSLGTITIDESALLSNVHTAIAGKSDASNVYTQTELDTIHATFAPASTTYTKTQVDAGLTAKLNTTTYNSGLALKANLNALNATNENLATKADAADTTANLALKVNTTTFNTALGTKLNANTFTSAIVLKADLSSLQATNTTLATKANITDMNTLLSAKANVSALNFTNTALTTKSNISDMTTALNLKANLTALVTINTSLNAKAPQASLDTTNTNLGTLTSTVSSLTTQVNSQASQDAPFIQIPQVYTDLGLNASGNGESFYHNGHRLAAQSFLVGKDKYQETQPEDSYYRYIGYIDLLNDYTQGSYDFNDPYGEIRFRNNCKIRMKNNSVETLVPFTQTSDGRAKTNKEEIRSGLDAVLRLKPQTYEKHGKTESGFITQEVLEIPELKHLVDVPENKDEYQSLNYIGIIAHLVSAIQELNNKLK
ncbi:unnamed protein product [Bathycoccus prasinos]